MSKDVMASASARAPQKAARTRPVRIGSVTVGSKGVLSLIAGPCVIEGEAHALRHARALRSVTKRLGIPFIYKSSYDKANRSSVHSFRGPGLEEGLRILRRVKDALGIPVLTDVHSPEEARLAAEAADVLQIPAFLCRQTDLLLAAADTGLAVNIKKGQFMAPWEMRNAVEKVAARGNSKILLTERGTFFGYNTLVNDMRGIPLMKEFGYPVIFDATHSVQQPGGKGNASGGERRFIPTLAQAAVAAGCHGIFMEVHERPDSAPSDGPNMWPLGRLEALLEKLLKIHRAACDES